MKRKVAPRSPEGFAAASAKAKPSAAIPEMGFVRLPQILAVFPICKSSWWAGVKSGLYPAPVKLSANVTAWRVEDIRALIERKARGA